MQEAVHRLEAQAPLHDEHELASAAASASGHAAQVRQRAWLLAERLGLLADWHSGRRAAAWAVLLLATGMAVSGLLLAQTVLGQGRSFNAVAAWWGLLGAHAFSLLLWVLGLLWPASGAAGASGAGASGPAVAVLGRAALWVAARLAAWGGAGQRVPLLLQAGASVLRRHGLLGWLSGALSHSVWALALLMAWGALAFGFAFRAYTLTWESTILGPALLQGFVRHTGALPALLGFPVPDVGLAASGVLADARAWAWWLLGCLLVYGLLPRLLLAAWCGWRWRRGQQRLAVPTLDLADPATRRLIARLEALQSPPQVIDPERPAPASTPAVTFGTAPAPAGWALLGFELPPEAGWPPADLPAPTWQALLDGSSAQRSAALARLARQPPQALLWLMHGPASPDRGTADFMAQALRHSPQAAVLLHAAQPADAARWQQWLAQLSLPASVPLLHTAAQVPGWLALAPPSPPEAPA